MADNKHTKYQQNLIQSYYQNLDAIMLQKLQELVTELYLALNTPKEDRLWERVQKAMIKLKIPAPIMEHIIRRRNVEILARNVQEWYKQANKK
ncbi:MAG: hypothetical protein JW860_00065 [Sedimentisphaerales bacterium]|nr:hypothetical protein [Sedimentisphaerales bacterium]